MEKIVIGVLVIAFFIILQKWLNATTTISMFKRELEDKNEKLKSLRISNKKYKRKNLYSIKQTMNDKTESEKTTETVQVPEKTAEMLSTTAITANIELLKKELNWLKKEKEFINKEIIDLGMGSVNEYSEERQNSLNTFYNDNYEALELLDLRLKKTFIHIACLYFNAYLENKKHYYNNALIEVVLKDIKNYCVKKGDSGKLYYKIKYLDEGIDIYSISYYKEINNFIGRNIAHIWLYNFIIGGINKSGKAERKALNKFVKKSMEHIENEWNITVDVEKLIELMCECGILNLELVDGDYIYYLPIKCEIPTIQNVK